MASPLILDTSGIVALYDADSSEHRAFVAAAFAPGVTRILPSAILSEIEYMLTEKVNRRAGKRFVEGVVQGFFEIEPFTDEDARYVQHTIEKYPALSLSLADCTVMSLAERLGCPRILTTDRRHFLVVKPRAFEAFEIVDAASGKRQRPKARK